MANIEAQPSDIVDNGLHLHRHLRPGHLETGYENALAESLRRRGSEVWRQVSIDVVVADICFDGPSHADLVGSDIRITEVKSTEQDAPSRLRVENLLSTSS